MSMVANRIAKLFNTSTLDGVVFKDTDRDGDPCIVFLVDLDEYQSSLKLSFRDFDARDEKFDSIDEQAFVNTIRGLGF